MDLENRQQLQSSMKASMTGSSFEPAMSSPQPNSDSDTMSSKMKKPAKKMPVKMIIGVAVLVLTIVGGAAGFLLSETNQDLRQQASEGLYGPAFCFTTADECATFNLANCSQANNYPDSVKCNAALNPDDNPRTECTAAEIATCDALGRGCEYSTSLGRGQCTGSDSNKVQRYIPNTDRARFEDLL